MGDTPRSEDFTAMREGSLQSRFQPVLKLPGVLRGWDVMQMVRQGTHSSALWQRVQASTWNLDSGTSD